MTGPHFTASKYLEETHSTLEQLIKGSEARMDDEIGVAASHMLQSTQNARCEGKRRLGAFGRTCETWILHLT
eukprot:3520637-Pleurochrysis_carterae.AAC.1